MWFRRRKRCSSPDVLSSLMQHTREFIVCFEFAEPIDVADTGEALNTLLRDAVVVEASVPLARFLGFENRADLIGKHMMDLLSGDVPAWFVDYGQDVEDRGFEDMERVVDIPIGDGRVSHARIYMQNIIENGFLLRQWVTLRDVTAETRRKRDLETSERTKSLALQAADLHTFSVDFSIGAVAVDTAGLGDIPSEAKSFDEWAALIDPADFAAANAQLEAFRRNDLEALHLIFRVTNRDLIPRWVEVWGRATARDADGRATGVAGVYRDTTEARELESKLRSVQRLETLGMLAGGIAHDFNNLLMTILGSTELVRVTPAELPRALDQIEAASQQASELCSQMLSYAGKGGAPVESLDLVDLSHGILDLLKISVGRNVTLDLHAVDPVWVQGDASQLRQVVMNLVQNAAEAHADGPGDVRVEVGRVAYEDDWASRFHLGVDLEPGEYGYIQVDDSGVGMAAEAQEHLFDPFYTTKFAGRGLGLAVVLGVVRGHRGGILVESEIGEGTRIRVVIPSGEAPVDVPKVIGPKRSHEIRGRALVVDDERAVLRTIKLMLESFGLEVETAEGGAEAVERLIARDGAFDVILMDMTMPQVDGPAAATRILELYPDSRIILTSGFTGNDVPVGLEGRVQFIQKPYRIDALAQVVASVMRNATPSPA